ncbi:hypothetical protein R5R35_003176 [Gryllus longicercus]|uniref:Uncharacterized protein n=1 Tax=Gryllus longicercus TaxID=2509291 RepID=A0AAN9Z1K5_9ORTH
MGSIAMEEYELMKDSKYRVYVSAVDKALKNFEYTSEWADLISALGKLNKVLLNYMKFPVIPRRIKISKRLAQCMHPALPSGVHLKALETYDIIFKCMGTNRLSHELFIYSAGLFPLLGHAAMNVRPSLLTVYETHFVPLGERLRPGLSGFLSGVLPGLEEGSDHFERTTSLLEKVCEGVGPPHFYGCLWDCLAANTGIRLPAISFVLSHFNKKLSMEDQLYIMGTNIDVMVSALCAGVQDGSVLVQRSALDLLLVGFPMHNSQLVRSDMVRLVTAALVTILRRDMSLNRRLFAWLLGSEVNTSLLGAEHPLVKRPSSNSNYFDMYSRDMLIQAVKITLSQGLGQNPPDVRPYRLLVSLLDKQDIGPIILDDILFEVFRTLYLSCGDNDRTVGNGSAPTGSRSSSQEILKAANLLFSSLEPCYIWQYTGTLFSNACQSQPSNTNSLSQSSENSESSETRSSKGHVRPVGSGPPDLEEVCTLTEFLLDSVSLEAYVETPGEHLPGLFLYIVTQLTEGCGSISPSEVARALQLCAKILTRVQPPVLTVSTEPNRIPCDVREPKSLSNVSLESSPVSENTGPSLEHRSKSTSDLATEGAKVKNKSSRVKKLNAKLRLRQSKGSPLLLSVQPLESEPVTIENNLLDTPLRASTGNLDDLDNLERDDNCDSQVSAKGPENEAISIAVPSRQQSLLEQCLRQYEQFYVKFVGGQGVISGELVNQMFSELLVSHPRETDAERTEKLEALLSGDVPPNAWCIVSTRKFIPVVSKREGYEQWEEPMRVACSLLVELSTFPNYCLPDTGTLVNGCGDNSVDALPEWLRVLVVLACSLTATPSLQLLAIGTLLDLMSLVRVPDGGVGPAAAGGTTPVVMVPLLKSWQLHFLEYRTCAVEVLARALWQHLGQLEPHLQMNCVELLHQLHNVLPASDAVEDIIGEALTQDGDDKKMEALQHFSLLWHLGRELEAKSGSSRTLRTFDRSLLKMLDHLQRPESCPLRLQAQAWLLHSLVRGDVARLLDPLLLLLLEPNTARLSVLHVSIQHSNTVVSGGDARTADGPDERASARIYAISSVDGNVIYHVSEDNSHRSGQQRMANDDPVRAKRIFAVTTLVGGDSAKHYITEKTPHLREIDFPTSFLARQNISVFVNPFAASHVSESAPEDECIPETRERSASMPDFLRHATRLHPPGRSLSGSTSEDAGPVEETEITASFQSRCTSDPDSPRERSAENDGSDSSSSSTEGADGSQGRSWSAVDDVLGEPEESTAAEDYFKNSAESSSVNVVQDILKEVLDKVAKQCAEDNEVRPNAGRPMSSGSLPATSVTTAVGVHPLHSHMLLYCGVYDSGRALYALRTLRAVLLTHARMFLCAAAATGLAGQQTAGRRAAGLQVLLARHRKSVFGRSFHGDLASLAMGEYSAAYRSSMYLEVLMSVCLYYSRSFYPNLGQMRLTPEEIAGNRQVQLASAELLMLICSELIVIVRDSGRGFACYLADLLVRCKVQKVVLHCVVASVYDMSCVGVKPSRRTFTEEIVSFNDPVIEHTDSVSKCRFRSSEHSEGFQIQLLRLLLALLMLEHQVSLQKGEDATTTPTTKESKESSTPTKNPHQKYTAGVAIPEQPMFLSGILSALKMEHMRHLHQQWTALVTSALPFMGSALTPVVMSVVSQLCCNLEKLSQFYNTQGHSGTEMICCLPPDYTVTQLESLTLLSHYCLLDSAQQQSHAFSQPLLGGVGSAGVGAPGAGPGQVFSNLVHVFMPSPLQETSTAKDKPGGLQDTLMTARLTMLSNLPRILASVASLWQAVLGTSEREQPSCVLGSARVVKHQLLELLSPISLHHGPYFLAAVAVAWQDRRPLSSSSVKVVPVAGPEQQVLVSLVGALRVLPMDTLVQTVHSVLRQPPPIQGAKQDLSLEVSLLELFYCCLKGCAGVQLAESWGSLLPLLRDGLTLSPPAQFLLLAVLSEYVHRCPPLAERKDQRDLQDITAKLVESCAQIAGACLEQTTWLRRNLAVREEEPVVPAGRDKDNGGVATTSLAAQFSVQAQSVLAELLAPLLDVSYGSQEKEKVVALLTALMYNITPYLKNHTRRNVPSFQACSQLLASLSSYQYTRKAWRKDVFDLLLDPSLFQMEAHCLPLWRTIVDNLMTHDNTTFRDLMSRVSLAQSGSLSIFSSREQEYEQRAQLLKRLAFVLLCSEMDQYHKYMPEIQERLADSLRLPQVVPNVQAQVFLCFRVLLLRMSSQHVTSLWPIIISELVQVFLHIEQELSTDSEEFSSHIRLLSALDSSWVVNSNNGLHAHGHPAWLQLQLSAAKLLDLALALPAHRLPQFQMYRWAFVGGSECPSLNNNQPHDEPARSPDFVPHVARIARLMDTKFGGVVDPLPRLPGQLLLRSSSIHTMQELHPFFTSLSTFSTSPTLPEWSSSLGQLEAALETDFLERLPNK